MKCPNCNHEWKVERKTPEFQGIVQAFADEFKRRTNQSFAISWGKHGKLAKGLLNGINEIDKIGYVKKYIPVFFAQSDRKWWDFTSFVANFNKLQARVSVERKVVAAPVSSKALSPEQWAKNFEAAKRAREELFRK